MMRFRWFAPILLCLSPPPAIAIQLQVVELVAADATEGAFFGNAVSLDQGVAVIGARLDHPTGPVIGAAYVFESGPGGWRETQKLLPQVPLSSMRFGSSVGISGDWIAVGADGESFSTGAVYMFLRQGGTFVQTQKLQASDGGARFGESLDLHGDRLIVGSPFKSQVFSGDGAAYVFEKIGSAWVETAKLTASDPVHSAVLGTSVAIRGDLAVCGASLATGPPASSGAAYVFERGMAGWNEVQKLVPAQSQSQQSTGQSVALLDDLVFVGAPNWDGTFNNQGACFVFQRQGATWIQTQQLTAADPGQSIGFGNKIAAEGERLLLAAPFDADHGSNSGSAYSFHRSLGGWQQVGKLLPDNSSVNIKFGTSVALSGDTALIGAQGTDGACPTLPSCDSGSAYVFRLGVDSTQYCSCPPPEGPCGNHDDHGGCRSSVGHGAVLSAAGSGSWAADDLEMVCRWLPASTPALLFMGGGTTQVPFGDGRLCVASAGQMVIQRYPAVLSDASGTAAFGPGLRTHALAHFPRVGQLVPGTTWTFQVWFRDPAGPCATVTNLSNALSVTFRP